MFLLLPFVEWEEQRGGFQRNQKHLFLLFFYCATKTISRIIMNKKWKSKPCNSTFSLKVAASCSLIQHPVNHTSIQRYYYYSFQREQRYRAHDLLCFTLLLFYFTLLWQSKTNLKWAFLWFVLNWSFSLSSISVISWGGRNETRLPFNHHLDSCQSLVWLHSRPNEAKWSQMKPNEAKLKEKKEEDAKRALPEISYCDYSEAAHLFGLGFVVGKSKLDFLWCAR